MSSSESRSAIVLELAEEFLERYRQGHRPSLKDYIDRHPSLADEIREVFPAMAMMEKIALADESLADDPTGAVAQPKAPPLEQLGDYRILREIGRGGMGVVYEAEQVSLGRNVALKLLPPQILRDAKQRHRFEREARSAAKLHHTNIVPVFGVGEHDETPYYVMQFIQGLGLDEVLDELKRIKAGSGQPDIGSSWRRAEGLAAGRHGGGHRPIADDRPVRRRRDRGAAYRCDERPGWDLPARRVSGPGRRDDHFRKHSVRQRPARRLVLVCPPRRFRSSAKAKVPMGEDRGRGSRPTGKAWRGSACRWPMPWSTPTSKGSSIATSSRRTCSWTPGGRSGWPTSGWPRPATSPT